MIEFAESHRKSGARQLLIHTDGEKAAIKAGEIPKEWQDKPARLRQKDRDARWTVKFAKAKPKEGEVLETNRLGGEKRRSWYHCGKWCSGSFTQEFASSRRTETRSQ
jgi:hypothetical protein